MHDVKRKIFIAGKKFNGSFLAIFVCGAASRAIFLAKQVFVYWSPLCGNPYSIRVLSDYEKFWLVTGHFWLVTCLVTPVKNLVNKYT